MDNVVKQLRQAQKQELRHGIAAFIGANPQLTLREIAEQTGTPIHHIWNLCEEFGLKRKRGTGSPAHKKNAVTAGATNG